MGRFGETIIPAALKIPGDQTIFRVDRIVLSMRMFPNAMQTPRRP